MILFREEHTPRVLVPRVDFVSAPGTSPPGVHRPGGPSHLLTGKALFDFDRAAARFRLAQVHPGETVAGVRAATGFDFDADDGVAETRAPDAETLSLLRGPVARELAPAYPHFVRTKLDSA